MKQFIKKNVKIISLILSILITILLGTFMGGYLVYQKGLPKIKSLEDIRPIVMTTLYDDANIPIREFANEKRIILKSEEIPDILKKAIVAAEDHAFYSHWGINFKGFFRAVIGRMIGKRWGGGSSITQQLARRLFLTPEVSLQRKLKEMLLSIQIERKYTKDQILTFYCNQMLFGASAYGVEAAAYYYFGKSVKELNLAEAAMLASIIPGPNRKFNVYLFPDRVKKRRDLILAQMFFMKMISRDQYQQAVNVEVPQKNYDRNKEGVADYFSEEIRKYLYEKYGESLLYRGGLKVYSTLNREMQVWAEQCLREGVRRVDKMRGWRTKQKLFNVLENHADLQSYRLSSWEKAVIEKDQIVEGIVLDVTPQTARVKIEDFRGDLSKENAAWTWRPLPTILKKGDVAQFRIKEIDPKAKKMTLGLEQPPELEGAMLVVDNETGAIKAMVGGYNFDKSEWNRAIQATRQPGSSFKPIIYTAALEHGFNPATIIMDDDQFEYIDETTQVPWKPSNFEGDYMGPLTFRRGLELSRNVITAQIINQITPEVGLQYARRFGITSPLKPYMSMALGAFEVTLKEMVEAFTVFANLGTGVQAYFIKSVRDLNNYLIEENLPRKRQVLEKETAFVINYLLQGVVRSGTGFRARKLPAPVGGKTGTTNDFMDAWFIGFTPSLTVGIWIGYDLKLSMGKNQSGQEAASPVFVSFMEKYLQKYPESKKFRAPAGIVWVDIDKYTGKRLQPECLYPFREAFLPGTEPGPLDYCSEEEHQKISHYYKSDSDS